MTSSFLHPAQWPDTVFGLFFIYFLLFLRPLSIYGPMDKALACRVRILVRVPVGVAQLLLLHPSPTEVTSSFFTSRAGQCPDAVFGLRYLFIYLLLPVFLPHAQKGEREQMGVRVWRGGGLTVGESREQNGCTNAGRQLANTPQHATTTTPQTRTPDSTTTRHAVSKSLGTWNDLRARLLLVSAL